MILFITYCLYICSINAEFIIPQNSSGHIIVPSNWTRILKYSFNSCDNLLTVIIPATVMFIEDNAFNLCSKLLYASYHSGTCLGVDVFPPYTKIVIYPAKPRLSPMPQTVLSNTSTTTPSPVPSPAPSQEWPTSHPTVYYFNQPTSSDFMLIVPILSCIGLLCCCIVVIPHCYNKLCTDGQETNKMYFSRAVKISFNDC